MQAKYLERRSRLRVSATRSVEQRRVGIVLRVGRLVHIFPSGAAGAFPVGRLLPARIFLVDTNYLFAGPPARRPFCVPDMLLPRAAAGKTPAGGSAVARIFGASPFT